MRAIVSALLRTQEVVPGLQVIVKPDCRGRTWIVDTCCKTIYLSGSLPAGQASEALADALDALVAELRRSGWDAGDALVSIPQQRDSATEMHWHGMS